MTVTTRARFRAAAVAIAPTVLLVGFVAHPYVAKPTDEAALADVVVSDTTRWGLSHLTIGIGYALAVLAFLALRSYLRDAGEERWSVWGLPFAAFGCALFTILTGMEFAPLAAAETGGDVEGAQTELFGWFIPILLTGALTFALGAIGFAMAIVRTAVLARELTWLVAAAFVLMAAARFVPLGAAQILIGLAGIAALWPLAYEMWRRPVAQPREHARPMPAA